MSDVVAYELRGLGGPAVRDEGDEAVVLVEVTGAGLVAGREFEAQAAVAVGFVPQVSSRRMRMSLCDARYSAWWKVRGCQCWPVGARRCGRSAAVMAHRGSEQLLLPVGEGVANRRGLLSGEVVGGELLVGVPLDAAERVGERGGRRLRRSVRRGP
ncbi:hypothetical protein [Streptomyces milbemycinicus]|uniref:hypothetical protein n=1 Tax=Streptomyces milbemycinicus TaxID=476552 RepID=UPI0033EA0BCD